MTRDYKNRRAPVPAPSRPRAPCWLWGATGLAVGLFAAFLVYLGEHRPATTPGLALAPVAPTPVRDSPEPAPAPPKPRFEFYTILPEMEVPVEEPALPPRAAKDAAPEVPPAAPEEPSRGRDAYLLQVGSFRSLEEADRLKARLALLGLEPRIQTVTVDGERTWHRVRVGPYATPGAAYQARDRLRRERVEAIVLKVAGG